MSNPIMPSIGRIVLVRGFQFPEDTPAIVTKVHSQECINAMVFLDDGGPPIRVSSISYVEAHEIGGAVAVSFHWMDYQLKVAEERNPNTGEAAATSPAHDDGRYGRQRSVEYGIEAWKAMPQKERESTSILQLAADFNTFIEGPPPPE